MRCCSCTYSSAESFMDASAEWPRFRLLSVLSQAFSDFSSTIGSPLGGSFLGWSSWNANKGSEALYVKARGIYHAVETHNGSSKSNCFLWRSLAVEAIMDLSQSKGNNPNDVPAEFSTTCKNFNSVLFILI